MFKITKPIKLLVIAVISLMCCGVSFAVTPSDTSIPPLTKPITPIWNKIGEHLNLNHYQNNPRVKKEIARVLANKQNFQIFLNRSTPYIYHIYTQTQLRHLPAEIALIPIIESEYNPNDHNSIGALGLWQLMPATAKILGVKMRNGYDGRRNLIESTNAALVFFKDLSHTFNGNWNLSFAAYNCGPGCVSSAIRRAGTHDFFKLKVPLDTRYYVPRLLAMAELIKHAKHYGINLPKTQDTPFFKEVKVNKTTSLTSYAKSNGTNLDILKKLNPDYQHSKTIALARTLLVPINS